MKQPCWKCGGTGTVYNLSLTNYETPCPICGGTGYLDDAVYHVQQPETNIQLTNEQIDRLVECVVDLMKTLYPLIEDVLKTVKHYFDDIEEGEDDESLES